MINNNEKKTGSKILEKNHRIDDDDDDDDINFMHQYTILSDLDINMNQKKNWWYFS